MIEGFPLYEDRTEGMGAVAGYTYGEHTVVFVGTRSGQLKKVGPGGGQIKVPLVSVLILRCEFPAFGEKGRREVKQRRIDRKNDEKCVCECGGGGGGGVSACSVLSLFRSGSG